MSDIYNNIYNSMEIGTTMLMPLAPPAPLFPSHDNNDDEVQDHHRSVNQDQVRGNGALLQQDPFLYFSDDENRMSFLHGNNNDTDSTAKADQAQAVQAQVQEELYVDFPKVRRKTCISFEVHQDVLLDEVLSQLDELKMNTKADPRDDRDQAMLNDLEMLESIRRRRCCCSSSSALDDDYENTSLDGSDDGSSDLLEDWDRSSESSFEEGPRRRWSFFQRSRVAGGTKEEAERHQWRK